MGIEERELHYPPDRPLRAWRLFRVRTADAGPLLSSPMYHDPDPRPWPDVGAVASCHEGHPAPAPGCRCGIYAVVEGTLDSLPGYLLDTAHDLDPWAYAEIACSGRVFVDVRGVRAERAEIVRIALPGQAALDAAKGALHERYGVAVGGLDGVPGWVTGNRRDTGPPPDVARGMSGFRPATITTDRLVLAPLRAEDADAMVEVLGDEQLHEFIGGRPLNHDDLLRRYERLAEGSGKPDEIWLNWIVRLDADRRAIGTVQATVTRLGAGWGAAVAWVIGVPWQGHGFATEAARALVDWLRDRDASVVTAHIHPGHRASARVAARAGLIETTELVDGERVWTTMR